jgi:hypothetical protein
MKTLALALLVVRVVVAQVTQLLVIETLALEHLSRGFLVV